MRPTSLRPVLGPALLLLALHAGCTDDGAAHSGLSGSDAAADAAPPDAVTADGRVGDAARPGDAGPADDAGHGDDAAPMPDAARDAVAPDAAPADAAPADAARPGDAAPDAAGPDALPPDAAGPADATHDAAVDAASDAGAPDAGTDAAPDAECVPGDSRACGSDVGHCQPGVQACGDGGRWGPCLGALGPQDETCNGEDDDCDGSTDEDVTEACALGNCQGGVRTCADGVWGECVPMPGPAPEECNGLDDDCDGAIDEDVTRACGSSTGACMPGVERCADGQWGACEGAVDPTPETCNGVDDDCNGVVDDGGAVEVCNGADDDCDGSVDEDVAPEPCGSDVGACQPGTRACVDGAFGECVGAIGPTDETCNGVDDDCNGMVDDGIDARPCDPMGGDVCGAGVQRCVDGMWSVCAVAGDEACNGLDDDCDGTVDEDVTPVACGSNVGTCQPGVQRCADGALGPCEGAVGPSPEACNGLDDDCDGTVDEDQPDRDHDGLDDCVEAREGLNPDDPTDAIADPDHDGVITRDEVHAGTQWRPVFSLVLQNTDPGFIEVSLQIDQTFPELQPDIAEIYIRFTDTRAAYDSVRVGGAAHAAHKNVAAAVFQPGLLRVVVVGANLDTMAPGELARLRFRRTSPDRVFFRFDANLTRVTPDAAEAALTYGTGHPNFPIIAR